MRKTLLIIISLFLITNPLFAGGNRWTSKPPIGSQIDWSHPRSRGLVGCWLMNEGGGNIINDITGYKNNGLNSNSTWTSGNKGNSLKFNGTTSFLNCGSNSSLDNLHLKGGLTFVAWIYPISAGETSLGRIFTKGNVGQGGYLIFRMGATGAMRFIKNGITDVGRTASNNSIIYNTWQQVAVTWTGSVTATSIKIYVNGKEVTYSAAADGSFLDVDTSYSLIIGGQTDSANTFDGLFNNAQIWNRILSSQEIKQLYQDPYCFIKPPTMWSMFSTAVAAARRFFIFD